MAKLLIVFHSMTGGTRQMARAAAQGASGDAALQVSLMQAAAAGSSDVLAADAYLFASPENLAAVSGQMKDFFDRTYYAALDRVCGRPYGILVCAGSDGSSAVRQIERIATGWRLKLVAAPVIIRTRASTPEEIMRDKVIPAADLRLCADLGATLASGTALGIF